MAYLKTIRSLIGDQSPIQARFLEKTSDLLSADDIQELEDLIGFYIQKGQTCESLAASYLSVVDDFMTEQAYFRKHKKYRYSSLKEVMNQTYLSDEYMEKSMLGLSLTQFLWPNHHKLFQFFKQTLPTNKSGTYLEIGPGHGLYFSAAIRLGRYDKYLAVDLSPKSLEVTKAITNRNVNSRFECVNFLSWKTEEKFDALVMGEVLEHLENPLEALQKVRELTHPESYIYITTCMNSPALDHIFLFREISEIYQLFAKSKLKIIKELILPADDKESDSSPANVGFVLQHEN